MATDAEQRDLVITGARIFTADPARPWADALVTRGKRIAFVGTERDALDRAVPGAERIDLSGGLVTPGLNEAHVHLTMGSEVLHDLNLDGIGTLPELQECVRRYAAAHPEREWITGYGLSYSPFSRLDRAERLVLDDAAADRPVFLRALDFHSAWCNTKALTLANIREGAPLPLPNEVVIGPDGLATGMLKERQAYHLIERLWPTPSRAARDALLAEAMRYMNSLGITSFQNMDGDPERVAWFERLHLEGKLSLRAHFYLSMREHYPQERLQEFAEVMRGHQGEWNLVRGIKMFIDGVVESKTALLLDPYADGSPDTGVPDMNPQAHFDISVEADRLGMDVATHAIGDKGVRLALDAYEAAARANPGRRRRRHRIEHIETIHPADIPRFAQLGVTASMQPLHAVPNDDPRTSPWTTLVGPAREPWAFPWRLLRQSGAVLAFGSDWPVVTPDPRIGIHAALTRRTLQGDPPGGWQPQHCLTLAETLLAYTRGGAYAESMEESKGILREGALADIACFDRDLFALSPRDILASEVLLTVVDGRVVHRTR